MVNHLAHALNSTTASGVQVSKSRLIWCGHAVKRLRLSSRILGNVKAVRDGSPHTRRTSATMPASAAT